VPLSIAVNLTSLQRSPAVETTFTENVSSGGARVLSTRRWRPGDRLSFALLPGEFRVSARVVYCHSLRQREFAVGLEFLEPVAHWFLSATSGSGDNLHG
jgi:hypothetical protein